MRILARGLIVTTLFFGLAPAALAVVIDWTLVGGPGNVCETQSGQGCFGAVGTPYNIGTYEVTNAQYAEFLNAKAEDSDPFALYNTNMGSPVSYGGITRADVSGGFSYSAIVGREDMPVNWVSLFDALRFANWLHNGQGNGGTETGAYTLLGGTPIPSNGTTVTRAAGAKIFVPSENEWYKAAYHNAIGLAATDYFDYPAGSSAQTTCSSPSGVANRANCGFVHQDLTDVGSYTASASPHGTFDQGGNVHEWNETIIGGIRGARGGAFDVFAGTLAATERYANPPNDELDNLGFRVAPEPDRDLLLPAGLAALLILASRRALGRQSVEHPVRRARAAQLESDLVSFDRRRPSGSACDALD